MRQLTTPSGAMSDERHGCPGSIATTGIGPTPALTTTRDLPRFSQIDAQRKQGDEFCRREFFGHSIRWKMSRAMHPNLTPADSANGNRG
jgi:hypothetical protein